MSWLFLRRVKPGQNLRQSVADVVAALEAIVSGQPLTAKVITSRFGNGLPAVSKDELTARASELNDYLRRIPSVSQDVSRGGGRKA
jgi:hypothetical protein